MPLQQLVKIGAIALCMFCCPCHIPARHFQQLRQVLGFKTPPRFVEGDNVFKLADRFLYQRCGNDLCGGERDRLLDDVSS